MDWFYAQAPLELVHGVEICGTGFCIGLLLHYNGFERTIGQYRLDKLSTEDCVSNPLWIEYTQERDRLTATSHAKIKFWDHMPEGRSKRCYENVQKMVGVMTCWVRRDRFEVSIV
jgi:hypothetical protein